MGHACQWLCLWTPRGEQRRSTRTQFYLTRARFLIRDRWDASVTAGTLYLELMPSKYFKSSVALRGDGMKYRASGEYFVSQRDARLCVSVCACLG